MDIELQIVILSIVAMIGIVGMPAYVFWMFWRKSGQALHEKEHHSH
jgi:flagellar basal body-associated protein FliL